MSQSPLPPLISPETLSESMHRSSLLIVCTGSREQYLHGHIPGAVYLDPARLNAGEPPVKGLLPPVDDLEALFAEVGLTRETHVVAYDDQATTTAARLFFVLEAMGHKSVSFLDGGLVAWQAASLPLESGETRRTTTDWQGRLDQSVLVDRHEILAHLERGDVAAGRVQILDSRSREEFQGLKSVSERKGRIPGAVNLNWLDTIGEDRRLKPRSELLAALADRGVVPESDVIVHCQTHQRSSHSFMMLRSLGFGTIRGYPGSWSEWSLDPALPIAGPESDINT